MATLGSHACIRTRARLTLERGGKKNISLADIRVGRNGRLRTGISLQWLEGHRLESHFM